MSLDPRRLPLDALLVAGITALITAAPLLPVPLGSRCVCGNCVHHRSRLGTPLPRRSIGGALLRGVACARSRGDSLLADYPGWRSGRTRMGHSAGRVAPRDSGLDAARLPRCRCVAACRRVCGRRSRSVGRMVRALPTESHRRLVGGINRDEPVRPYSCVEEVAQEWAFTKTVTGSWPRGPLRPLDPAVAGCGGIACERAPDSRM
jgi:hypothetical protein